MGGDLMDPVVGKTGRFHTYPVVFLLLHGVTGEKVEVVLADLLLIVERELPEAVDIVCRGRMGDIVCRKVCAVSRNLAAADAHRTIVEVAVVIPLLAEPGGKIEPVKDRISRVDVDVVAGHFFRLVQFMGDHERILREVDTV